MPILGIGKLPAALRKLSAFGLGQLAEHQSLQRKQLTSSASAFKVQSFAAKHKALQLGHTISLDFRGADCQLCFWGKRQASQHQPTFSSLNIKLGDVIVKLAAFEQIEQLYEKASLDWGGPSSEHNLPAFWKHDLQQHPSVYKKLAENLGLDNPMAKLIKKELDKDDVEPASKLQKTSTASEAEFWMQASKNLRKLVGEPSAQQSSFSHSKLQGPQLGRAISQKEPRPQLLTTNLPAVT